MAFFKVRCPVCYANIEITEIPEKCPACKEYIKDRIPQEEISEPRTERTQGLTTARTEGPHLKPW